MEAEGATHRTLTFEDFPNDSLVVFLVKNVSNTAELRQRIMSGTLEPEAAIINAPVLPDVFILHAAARMALQAKHRGALKARSLHAELVFSLSGSKHIGESLGRFGVAESSQHLIFARYNATPEEVQSLQDVVQGDLAPLSDLPALADISLINKYYKVLDEELRVGTLADAIVSRIAARDCM